MGAPDAAALVAVMDEVQALRTPQFVAGLDEPGFLERFLGDRLGSTTHVSVLDGDGRACSVTCTNGTGSGIVVPGTGIHLNNIMGEEDLNPLGFFRSPPGRRMPSMMSPTVVLDAEGEVELVVGSAGSNRIRSAILQVVVNVVDRGMARATRSRRRGCTSRTASSTPSRGSRSSGSRPPGVRSCASAAQPLLRRRPRPSSATRDGALSRWRRPTPAGAAVAA